MNKIKFSHSYPKLWKQKTAYLIQVRTIEQGAVSERLKGYDTHWVEKGDDGFYELPNTRLIQLIFLGEDDIPFCTLRRWTLQKENYYESLVGQEFEIVINSKIELQHITKSNSKDSKVKVKENSE